MHNMVISEFVQTLLFPVIQLSKFLLNRPELLKVHSFFFSSCYSSMSPELPMATSSLPPVTITNIDRQKFPTNVRRKIDSMVSRQPGVHLDKSSSLTCRLSAKCYLCYRNFHRNLPLKLSWFVRRYCLAHNYTVIICQVDFELDTLCLLVTEVNISELSLCFILTSGPSHFRSHWVVVLLTYQQ